MDFKKILPHIAAIILLLTLSLAYFYPQVQGKSLPQGDIQQWRASASEILEYKKTTGERTWWSNSMFGGMPAYQMVSSQDGNYLTKVARLTRFYIERPIGMFFGLMLLCYVSLIFIGLHPLAAIFGALCMGFSAYNLIVYEAGHVIKIFTIGYLIPIFCGLYLAYKGIVYKGALLYGLGLALAILMNHPQMVYYFLFSLIIWGIIVFIEAIKSNDIAKFLKTTGVIVAISILALATSASKLLPTMEYSRDTMRGKPILVSDANAKKNSSSVEGLDWDYAMNWSNGLIDVIASVVPGAAGGSGGEHMGSSSVIYQKIKRANPRIGKTVQLPMYWGDLTFTSGPNYFGVIFLFLMLFAIIAGERKLSIWIACSFVLFVCLSMGKNMEWFNRLFFNYMPLFNKFRTPNSVMSVQTAVVAIGSGYGLHLLLSDKMSLEEKTKKLIYAAIPFAVITLGLALIGPSLFDFNHVGDARYAAQGISAEDLITDRKGLLRRDSFRSFAFFALAFAGLFAYLKGKLNKNIAIGAVVLLSLVDVWMVCQRYLSHDDFIAKRKIEQSRNPRPVDEQIMKLEPHRGTYRVFDQSTGGDPFQSANSAAFHNSVGGYHPAKLQRFEDVKNRHLQKGNQTVFNMFNTKYFIGQDQKMRQNPGALGVAWFVDNIKWVNTNNEEIDGLTNLNPKQDVIIHDDFKAELANYDPSPNATISMTSYIPHIQTYKVSAAADAYAVFSEVWYGPNKGWQAYIDDQPVNHQRVNYIFRGLKIPSGEHTVRFEFDPSVIRNGVLISRISSILFYAMILFFFYNEFKNGTFSASKSTVSAKSETKKTVKSIKTKNKK